MLWCLQFLCCSYDKVYRSLEKQNNVADPLLLVCGSNCLSSETTQFNLYQALCHPRVTIILHYLYSHNSNDGKLGELSNLQRYKAFLLKN